MRWLVPALLLSLSACAPAIHAPSARLDSAHREVGKVKWTKAEGVLVCEAPPTDLLPKCPKKHGKFTVSDVHRATYAQLSYLIEFENGEAGYTPDIDYRYGVYDYDPAQKRAEENKKKAAEKAECDRRGGVRVGMTKAEVLASCWGKPERMNKTTTTRGTTEQWVYFRQYLYFNEDGRLTTIQH